MSSNFQIHRHRLRVYYEDTDLAGIVYYANYLRFIERGRTEMLRALDVDQIALKDATGIVFAVREVAAKFLRPAAMDDVLDVTTQIAKIGGARLDLKQAVLRDGQILFTADVQIAALKDGRATRIPAQVADKLRE